MHMKINYVIQKIREMRIKITFIIRVLLISLHKYYDIYLYEAN